MRLDAYTHFIPKPFVDKMSEVAGDHKDIGKRMRAVPAIYDLDVRKKVVDGFPGLRANPVLPDAAARAFRQARSARRLVKIINDGFADLCAKEKDRFPRLGRAGVARGARRQRARGRTRHQERRARRADLHQRRRQAARPARIRAVLCDHEPARQADLDSSVAHRRTPDYIDEKKSLYEIWWAFGWSYETAAAMARLVFSKTMDKYPNLKIILHHFGGIIPMLEGRIGPGWDQIGGAHLRRGLSGPQGQPQEAPARLFPEGRVGRFSGVRRPRRNACAGSSSIRTSTCCLRPTARSIRKKARATSARPSRSSTRSGMPKDKLDDIYYKNFEKLTGHTFVK